MSRYIILCEHPKSIEKFITNTDKYILTDKVTDNSTDVIYVSRNTTISEADLDMIATMLETRKVVVATHHKTSIFKKLVYRLFGSSYGGGNCGVIGIPHEQLDIIPDDTKINPIRIIKNAESKKLKIINLPLSKTEFHGDFFDVVSDLFYLFLLSQPLKFIFSSCVAFIVDCTLFVLIDKYMIPGLILPMVVRIFILQLSAWGISSLTNFFINRYFVFNSKTEFWPSLAEYYALAGVVFLLKTGLVEIIGNFLPFVLIIAKITAEVTFFMINYFIQKLFIFKKNSTSEVKESSDGTNDQADSSDKAE